MSNQKKTMSRKKSLSNIDFERYQEQKAFEKRLRTCIIAICKWKTTNTHYEDRFYRLFGMLKAPTIGNFYLSPFEECNFRIRKFRPELRFRFRDKYRCLGATLAFIIRQWWNYHQMIVSSGRLNHMINYLEDIADKRLNVFEIKGNVKKGWRLHR